MSSFTSSAGMDLAQTSYIHLLRLTGSASGGPAFDALAARLRLETILQNSSISLPGLPPTALLVVDKLHDRQLARFFTAGSLSQIPSRLVSDWEQAFSNCLANLAKQAARPLAGPVPAGAPAVLFIDVAEMLACLALDLVDGQAANQWWWRAIYPSGEYRTSLVSSLARSAQLIPPVIEALTRRGQSAAFARQLGEKTCRDLVQAELSVFQLDALEKFLEQAPERAENFSGGGENSSQKSSVGNSSSEAGILLHGGDSVPPYRHPRAASSAMARFQRLLDTTPENQAPDLSYNGRCLLAISSGIHRFPTALRALASAAASEPESFLALAVSQSTPADLQTERHNPAARPVPAGVTKDQEIRVPVTNRDEPPAQPLKTAAEASPQVLAQQSAAETSEVALVKTRFGGLFYLLNLAIHLGIYNDFTQPANPGWALSPWALLALLGTHWLGPAMAADPLWPLLLRLAGPPDTPDADPESPWSLKGGELNFTEFLDAKGVQKLQKKDFPNLEAMEQADSSWLAVLAAVMQRRLAQAFDHDHPLDMLSQPARIWVSSTRLDIHFDLASHPIEVRRSGLDRDPGWLPAAGRSIYYHYDA